MYPPEGGVDEPCACLKHNGAFLGSPSRGRYLVDSGRPERSTTDQSANGEPQPADRSVSLNGFHRIVRTAGVEAAWRGTAVASHLVERNSLQHGTLWFCEMVVIDADVGAHFEPPTHLARRESRWRPSSVKATPWARGDAPKTYTPAGIAASRDFTSSRS